jgi:DivIVA domain-containing protein
VTRIRPGYEMAEVDELIDRIEATLAGTASADQAVTVQQVRNVKFNTTRLWRHGYDEESVDNALDAYIKRLSKR